MSRRDGDDARRDAPSGEANPHGAVPIPNERPTQRRRSRVMQSSLDLVFSYSRSQQLRYGKLNDSAPSFVEPSPRSRSFPSRYGSTSRRAEEGAGGMGIGSTDVSDLEEEEESDEGASGSGSSGRDDVERDTRRRSVGRHGREDEDMLPDMEDERRQSAGSSGLFNTYAVPQLSPVSDRTPVAPVQAPIQSPGTASTQAPPTLALSLLKMYSPIPSPSVTVAAQFPNDADRIRRPTSERRGTAGTFAEDFSVAPMPLPSDDTKRHGNEEADISPTDERAPLLGDQGVRQRRASTRRRSSARRDSSARRRSSARRMSEVVMVGDSTDGQTLFNAVAVLVGIGLLSLPLAFSYAGWIGGTLLLVVSAAVTCYTAKLLARLIFHDPTLRGYTDIGRAALGSWAGGLINMLFCLELFALGIALVVLFGDSLNVLYPDISADWFKLMGYFIILPTALLPLRLLSLPSLLSTLSSFLLIAIILIDGLTKSVPPGSLRHPAPTQWGPQTVDANWLGAVGLILAGFGGHAVVPSLARDMKNPRNFDRVINLAFIIATLVSFIAGAAGYLMMGDDVSDEITRDMMQPKYGYPHWLNAFALWMIVVNPVTKFGLCSRPLNTTIESLLGISTSLVQPILAPPGYSASAQPPTSHLPSTHPVSTSQLPPSPTSPSDPPKSTTPPLISTPTPSSPFSSAILPRPPKPSIMLDEPAYTAHVQSERRKYVARVISRAVVTAAIVAAAIYLPGFERVMAFLGSFSAFLICIILPLVFYIRLAPRLGITRHTSTIARNGQWAMSAVCGVMMVAGTAWACLPKTSREGLVGVGS